MAAGTWSYTNMTMMCRIYWMTFAVAGVLGLRTLEAAEPGKILMVGNSLTSTYDIPKMLVGLAQSKGKTLVADSLIGGGKSLLWHLDEGPKGRPAADKVVGGGYDMLVLQDVARGMLKAGGPENLAAAVDRFVKLGKEANAKIALYAGFVRSASPSDEDVSKVMEAYTSVAQEHKIPCAPVALAFQRFLEVNGDVALLDNEQNKRYALDKTGTHQSPFGSYLAACTIYSALYDQSPEGSSYRTLPDGTELSPEDAALAQKVAWETWAAYKPTLGL